MPPSNYINAVGTGLVGSSGTGAFAGSNSPTFITPALGTPSSGDLSNCTGFPGQNDLNLTTQTYNTGTVVLVGKSLTGTGTTFTPAMIGGLITFTTSGNQYVVENVGSATDAIVAFGGSESSDTYVLDYNGVVATNSGAFAGHAGGNTGFVLGDNILLAGNTSVQLSANAGNITINADEDISLSSNSSGNVSLTTGGTLTLNASNLILTQETAHGILVAEAGSAVTTKVLTDGQLLIGDTDGDPVAASLTAGANITITPGAGTLTIAAASSTATDINLTTQHYSTGTISQSGTVITGTGTTFDASMVGGLVTYPNGDKTLVLGFVDATTLTATDLLTEADDVYTLDYNGLTGIDSGFFCASQSIIVPSTINAPDNQGGGQIAIVGSNSTIDGLSGGSIFIQGGAVVGNATSGSIYLAAGNSFGTGNTVGDIYISGRNMHFTGYGTSDLGSDGNSSLHSDAGNVSIYPQSTAGNLYLGQEYANSQTIYLQGQALQIRNLTTGGDKVLYIDSATHQVYENAIPTPGLQTYNAALTYNQGDFIRGDGTNGLKEAIYSCNTDATTGAYSITLWDLATYTAGAAFNCYLGNGPAVDSPAVANITGIENTFVGIAAGQSVAVSGNNNVGVGDYALFSYGTFSGAANTAVGSISMASGNATTAHHNTCLGYGTGGGLTTGSSNILIGREVGGAITTGDSNILIGYEGGSTTLANTFKISNPGNNNAIISLTGTNATYAANTFLATPNGAAGSFSNRAIVAADIPTLNQNTSGNAATVTTNANLTGTVVSTGNATSIPTLITAPSASASASLSIATAYQNTSGSDVMVTVYLEVTAATTASILLGVGPTNTPTQQTIVSSLTAAALVIIPVNIYIPKDYYALLSTSGTITQTISGQITMSI